MKTLHKLLTSGFVLLLAFAVSSCNGGSAGVPASVGQVVSSVTHVRGDTGSTSCVSMTCVYVYSATPSKGQISSYASSATGDIAPIALISGKKTGLLPNGPAGIAVGPDRKTYVVQQDFTSGNDSLLVFAAGANGNARPIATITGNMTGLLLSSAYVAVDNDGNIYVLDIDGCPHTSVLVYAAGSNGNVAPIQTIEGLNTGLCNDSGAGGIAVDSTHKIYVTNNYEASLLVFAAGSNGNVAPIQNISGPNTSLIGPFGMALDSLGNMYVVLGGSATSASAVLVFAEGATGNVAPIKSVSGTRTKLLGSRDIALDASANIYVVNNVTGPALGSYVTVYDARAHGNSKPIQMIKGPATALPHHGGTGIAVQ
jgi:hypothetical protein